MLPAGLLTGCVDIEYDFRLPAKIPRGNLITIVHDVPICNAISAAVVIQDLSFTETEGGRHNRVINTTALLRSGNPAEP